MIHEVHVIYRPSNIDKAIISLAPLLTDLVGTFDSDECQTSTTPSYVRIAKGRHHSTTTDHNFT
jgi:hypothetical protein